MSHDLETIKTACRESKLIPRYSSKNNTTLLMYCHKNHGGASELNVKIVDGQPVATCKVCGVIPDFLDRIGLKAEPATKPDVAPSAPKPVEPVITAAAEPPSVDRDTGCDDEPQVKAKFESRFKFKPLSEIVKQHPGMRTWWLRDYVPAGAAILIYGEPACGKTTIAADIGCSIATAMQWRGIQAKQGSILYVAAEDYYGARLRIEAWFERNGLSTNNDSIEMLDVPIVLAEESDVNDLIAYINSMSSKPATIIIDTLALSMGKYSENNDMQLFCNGATKIKTQTGVSVIVIHHCGHADKDRGRGGSQLPANADVIFQVKRKDDVCTMKCQKMKNGIEPPDLSWNMETQKTQWADEDTKPITSVVLHPTDNPVREDKPKKPSQQQDVALAILRGLIKTQQANLADCGIDPATARVLVSDWQAALVPVITSKATRSQVREALIDKELVVIDGLYVSLGS